MQLAKLKPRRWYLRNCSWKLESLPNKACINVNIAVIYNVIEKCFRSRVKRTNVHLRLFHLLPVPSKHCIVALINHTVFYPPRISHYSYSMSHISTCNHNDCTPQSRLVTVPAVVVIQCLRFDICPVLFSLPCSINASARLNFLNSVY